MQWYFWLLIILLVIAAIGFGVFYYLKYYKKEPAMHEYVWLGHGEHPFKKKEEEKK